MLKLIQGNDKLTVGNRIKGYYVEKRTKDGWDQLAWRSELRAAGNLADVCKDRVRGIEVRIRPDSWPIWE